MDKNMFNTELSDAKLLLECAQSCLFKSQERQAIVKITMDRYVQLITSLKDRILRERSKFEHIAKTKDVTNYEMLQNEIKRQKTSNSMISIDMLTKLYNEENECITVLNSMENTLQQYNNQYMKYAVELQTLNNEIESLTSQIDKQNDIVVELSVLNAMKETCNAILPPNNELSVYSKYNEFAVVYNSNNNNLIILMHKFKPPKHIYRLGKIIGTYTNEIINTQWIDSSEIKTIYGTVYKKLMEHINNMISMFKKNDIEELMSKYKSSKLIFDFDQMTTVLGNIMPYLVNMDNKQELVNLTMSSLFTSHNYNCSQFRQQLYKHFLDMGFNMNIVIGAKVPYMTRKGYIQEASYTYVYIEVSKI